MSLTPGHLTRLANGVTRLVAPNPSMMTGPGTNSYLLGDPPVAVIDPGPDDPSHVDAILAAAPTLATVFVTHTHRDHSSATALLQSRRGVQVIGIPGPDDGRQDDTFVSHRAPFHDEIFTVAGLALRAIATPGHASNHVCYLLERDGMLFSGDHVLDGVTPVILAPDGDMGDYLDALRRLLTYPLTTIAPGHGDVIASPYTAIDGVIAHRIRREKKVIDSLRAAKYATIEALVPAVYEDVRPELHGFARYTLEAHLIKLARDGVVRRDGSNWHA